MDNPAIQHQPVFQELLVRKSTATLIIRGLWTWITAVLLLIIFDQVFVSAPQTNATLTTLANQSAFTASSVVRPLLFFVYGAVMLYVVLGWASEYYIIRDDSISICSGIFSTRQSSYEIAEVEDAEVRQGWLGTAFNVGDVILKSPRFFQNSKTQGEIRLRQVPNPVALADAIQQLSFRWKKSNNFMSNNATNSSNGMPNSTQSNMQNNSQNGGGPTKQ